MKEAAVQRKHNLYRDSIVLTNSDPNLHLLEETPQVDWATKFGGDEPEGSVGTNVEERRASGGRRRQVVSMIKVDGLPFPYESCLEVPGVDLIPEEDGVAPARKEHEEEEECLGSSEDPMSPDSVDEIRDLINPMVEVVLPVPEEKLTDITSGTETSTGTITMEDGLEEQVTHVTTVVGDFAKKSVRDKSPPQTLLELMGGQKEEADLDLQEEEAIQKAIAEMELAVQDDGSENATEASTAESDNESQPPATECSSHYDSGFQSPTNDAEPIANGEAKMSDPGNTDVYLV